MSVSVTVNGASTLSASMCSCAPAAMFALFTLQEFRGRIDFWKRCKKKKKKKEETVINPHNVISLNRCSSDSLFELRMWCGRRCNLTSQCWWYWPLSVFQFPCWWPQWPRWGSVNSRSHLCTRPAPCPTVDTHRSRSGAMCCTSQWRCRSGWTTAARGKCRVRRGYRGGSQIECQFPLFNYSQLWWLKFSAQLALFRTRMSLPMVIELSSLFTLSSGTLRSFNVIFLPHRDSTVSLPSSNYPQTESATIHDDKRWH